MSVMKSDGENAFESLAVSVLFFIGHNLKQNDTQSACAQSADKGVN